MTLDAGEEEMELIRVQLMSSYQGTRLNALEKLTQMRDESRTSRIVALMHNYVVADKMKPQVQEAVAVAFGHFTNEVAFRTLLELCASAYWNVRYETAKSLGNYKRDEAYEKLLFMLNHEKDADVLEGVIIGLGTLQDARAIPLIADYLKSESWSLRDKAAEALGNIGGSAALEHLQTALVQERDAYVKESIKGILDNL